MPVHPGGVLRINTRRRVRRLRLDLDCPHRRSEVIDRTRWTFALPDDDCSMGALDVTYRRIIVSYTFNLRPHERCHREGSAAVVENELVRVYSHPSPADDGPDPSYPGDAFVTCRFDSGDELSIGRNQCGDAYVGCDFLEHVALAGEKVAYVRGRYNGRYGPDRTSYLTVLDTATWQPRQVISYDERVSRTYQRITAVVLKSNGSVGWILDQQASYYYSRTVDVWKADSGGTVLLDSDPEIDPASLLLDGSTLTWRRGEETRSATLD